VAKEVGVGALGDGPLWAAVATIVTALVAWLTQRKKSEIDESALVMEQWKKLLDEVRRAGEEENGRLKARVTALETDLAKVKLEYAEGLAAMKLAHADERLKDRRTIDALQRELSQISQSTAVQIGRVKDRAKKAEAKAEDAEGRITHLTDDKNAAHEEINEHLAKLDRAGDNSIGKGEE
jgi:hypothetical protein